MVIKKLISATEGAEILGVDTAIERLLEPEKGDPRCPDR